MAKRLSPNFTQQFFDDNGDPLVAGEIYTYVANSLTPIATYSDRDGTENTNPIVLDGGGRCSIFLGSALYKFVIKDADGVTIDTIDEIRSDESISEEELAEAVSDAEEAASNASDSADDASDSADAAETARLAAVAAKTAAETAETNAETAQAAASTSQSAAATSASSASTSAGTATTQAGIATTKASEASASAAAAATSEANASASATSAANVIPNVVGSRGTPQDISAGGGIAFTGTKWFNYWYVQGSGGAVDISANPQIAAGTNVGQRLTLTGCSDTNSLKLENGNGLKLKEGSAELYLFADSVAEFHWNGTNWSQI